ncbi:MAG TPA: VWA domain-containing protein [Terriglobia bacterium]|nr:VWA domain-containing protein [Terriglobia bacterium]
MVFRHTLRNARKLALAFVSVALASLSARTPNLAQTGHGSGAGPRTASNLPRAGQGYVLRAQTNVVLVDVRVWDKSGRPVAGLKESDFKVLEDGAPQTLTSFSFENVEGLATASAGEAAPATIDFSKLPPNAPVAKLLQDRRLIVLFFDLSSMPVDDLMRAIKAARHFVDAQMTPADLVAVALYASDLRVVQDFTNSRAALDKSLEAIRIGEASSLADSGTTGEAGATSATGEEVVTQDVSAAFTPDETEFNIFNTDEKLAAVQSLAEMLRGVPGRKSVIHFSSGIERTGIENQAQLRAATDAANRSDVSFYTVDARGLVGLPPGGDASTASPAGTAIYSGSAVSSQVSSLQGGRETLATLATDTGGRTFYDLNDFAPAFSQVQKENSTYYLLGYTPSNKKSDGRFRRIQVKVSRPGVKVEARPGYFAPKNFRQFTREDKEVQLEQAMDLDAPFVDLPLAVEAAYFRQPDDKFYVVLAAKIPGSAISFLQKSQTRQTEFDFAWRATDSAGHPVAALRDTLPVKLDPASYAQVLSSNILYEGGFVLPAGKYTLKVVVRENQSGKLGTFEQPLVLPETGGSALDVSSVVVSNQVENLAAGGRGQGRKRSRSLTSPLQFGSRDVLPSVTRVFRTNQNLHVYLESYAGKGRKGTSKPADSASGSANALPSVAVVFFRAGVKISEAGPFPGRAAPPAGGAARYFVSIPLAKFPPGRYWMQVNVLDPAADQVAFARVPLAIMKPPAAASSAGGK